MDNDGAKINSVLICSRSNPRMTGLARIYAPLHTMSERVREREERREKREERRERDIYIYI
jgi:hypothetical protein